MTGKSIRYVSQCRLLALLLLVSWTLSAAAPVLRDLQPRGAERGKAITLTLTGTSLAEGASVISTLPAAFAPLGLREGRMAGNELSFLVEVKPDAPVGLYPIRIRTPEGLSNVLLFSVGAFPELSEQESEERAQDYSNDTPENAQTIPTPVIVNGSLRGSDQDFYRLRAKPGERLVVEVEARRSGSAVDPLIRVFDSKRKELAWNDDAPGLGVDARLDVTFPSEGEYYVAVHDSKFSAQAQNFYRLKVGSYAYADGIFPLGWTRSGTVEVELFGGNLAGPVKVTPKLTTVDQKAGFTMISVPGVPGSLPFPFAVSDLPETLEPANETVTAIPPATVVNGRISKPGEVDRYKFPVAPGEHWMVELEKASLGTSRLYGVLTIYDSDGKKLASAGDVPPDPELSFLVSFDEGNADPYLAFKAPPGVREIVVSVEDLLQRGGPEFGYRLVARQQAPDFSLSLVTPFVNVPMQGTVAVVVNADRRGLIRPIRLSIPDLPDDLVAEGGHIPGEVGGQTRSRSSRQGVLTITPKPGAQPRTLQLAVVGEATLENGDVIRRRARGPGLVTAIRGANQKAFSAPWLGMELPATVVPERPAALEVVSPRYVRLVQGMESDVEWKFARRMPGLRGPARVNAGNIPGVGNLRVLGGKSKGMYDDGKLTLVTTVGTPPMKFDMVLDGQVTIEGRDETLVAPAITFEIVQGYSLEPSTTSATLAPGGKTEIAGRLRWEPAFTAPVTVKADNLPLHVSCQPAEVTSKSEEVRLPCQAGPGASPGEYDIELVTASTLAGRDQQSVPYTIPPVGMKLVVAEGKAEQ